MICSSKWATLRLVLTIWANAVFGQNPGIPLQFENTNVVSNNGPARSQLMSTLLSVAAANGVLPELLPIIQPALSNELPREIPKTLNLIQLPHQNQRPQELVAVAAKPVTINQTPITVSPYPNYNAPVLQTTLTPGQTLSHVCPVSHAVRSTSTYQEASVQPSSGMIQPTPAFWRAQPAANRSPEHWQPFVHDFPETRPMPANLQITPPSPRLGKENVIEEAVPRLRLPMMDGYDDMPVNLQINLPSQVNTPPRITVVAAPAGQQMLQEGMLAHSPFTPFSRPPIVVERSDSLEHILPIMLIALIANERDNCGCGCNCCCPSSSKSVIPIPYPIPFPINSLIVNTSSRSNKGQNKSGRKDDDDDDDDGDK